MAPTREIWEIKDTCNHRICVLVTHRLRIMVHADYGYRPLDYRHHSGDLGGSSVAVLSPRNPAGTIPAQFCALSRSQHLRGTLRPDVPYVTSLRASTARCRALSRSQHLRRTLRPDVPSGTSLRTSTARCCALPRSQQLCDLVTSGRLALTRRPQTNAARVAPGTPIDHTHGCDDAIFCTPVAKLRSPPCN
jgi:hypothetical protein